MAGEPGRTRWSIRSALCLTSWIVAGVNSPGARQFWHVGLRHWQLAPMQSIPAEPQPQHADGANFDHKLALLGWDVPAGGRITVYWRCSIPCNATTRSQSPSKTRPAARSVGGMAGPRATITRLFAGSRAKPLRALSCPAFRSACGYYYVALTIYDASDPSGLDIRDIADNPAGKRVRLGPVKLAP